MTRSSARRSSSWRALDVLLVAGWLVAGCGGSSAFLELDVDVEIGADVHGPEDVFTTVLGEVSVIGKDLRHARALAAAVLRDPPLVAASPSGEATG